jgi:hypothetical protein
MDFCLRHQSISHCFTVQEARLLLPCHDDKAVRNWEHYLLTFAK